jgi:hypothetical protein
MGLLMHRLGKAATDSPLASRIFVLFGLALVPSYLLSVLWWPLPDWLYVLVVLGVLCQLIGWVLVLKLIRKPASLHVIITDNLVKYLLVLCGIAYSIKLCLQAGSVVPSLSKLAFGFRPIVIGYIHLVVLAVITLFIITYCLHDKIIGINKVTRSGIILFTAGIFVNEVLLMIQGIYDINMVDVPGIPQGLLIAALMLFGGLAVINYGQFFLKDDLDHKTLELS